MTEIARIRQAIAEAQLHLDNLTAAAELAADRGSRGPSPKEIEQAEWHLAFQRRRLDLARSAVSAPLAPAMRGVR
ncbi:hypothetical protein [Bosea sp. MMO-172]|uniref:hypothetical protein n=1 Tax=Bosea sp. MMO-172 TaxID=3127885 RepID=UPI00301716B3